MEKGAGESTQTRNPRLPEIQRLVKRKKRQSMKYVNTGKIIMNLEKVNYEDKTVTYRNDKGDYAVFDYTRKGVGEFPEKLEFGVLTEIFGIPRRVKFNLEKH